MDVKLSHAAIWVLAAMAVAGMIARPWRSPEWVWPVGVAGVLVASGLLPLGAAGQAVAGGWDVYLFIGGLMLLSELARREGLFDWLAALAVERSRGSSARLFAIVYGVGVLVTVFMSNDATAVVLTPAVAAAARRARTNPLPHLFACAMVANAASFVLPISNPANLVVFGDALPALPHWVASFGLAAVAATIVTFFALRLALRRDLRGSVEAGARPPLARSSLVAAAGVGLCACALLVASAFAAPLGPAAAATSVLALAVLCLVKRESPWPALSGVAWTSLLLVAGLFVVVRGLEQTGLVQAISAWARTAHAASAGAATAVLSNVLNNLPAGMLVSSALAETSASAHMRAAVAVGIDLGPNLTVIGSLSSLLWLLAARREGVQVSALQFARVGVIVTPPAFAIALLLLA